MVVKAMAQAGTPFDFVTTISSSISSLLSSICDAGSESSSSSSEEPSSAVDVNAGVAVAAIDAEVSDACATALTLPPWNSPAAYGPCPEATVATEAELEVVVLAAL